MRQDLGLRLRLLLLEQVLLGRERGEGLAHELDLGDDLSQGGLDGALEICLCRFHTRERRGSAKVHLAQLVKVPLDLSGEGVGGLLVLLRPDLQVAQHVPNGTRLGGRGRSGQWGGVDMLPVGFVPGRDRLEFSVGVLVGRVCENFVVVSLLLVLFGRVVEGMGEKLVARFARGMFEGGPR